jgi:type I restriction enzyme S subunit
MVPEGWMLQPLGSLINFINGKAHEKNIVDSGQFALVNSKFISTEGLVKKYTDVALCPAKKNDVLIVMSDVPNGRAIAKCFFVTTDNQYTVNQRIGILRAKICNPKFLYYAVNRSSYFLKFDDGITQTNLRKDEVLECPIRVPPLSEQKKIAQILSTWDKSITTTEQLLANSQQQKKALMQQLLSGKKRLLDQNGVRFSGEWKDHLLGEVVEITTSTSKSAFVSESGHNFIIDMGSVSREGKLTPSKRTTLESDFLEIGQLVMPKDDIGGGNIIGRVGLILESKRYVLADHVYALKVLKNDSVFISYLINSHKVNKSLRRRANGTAQLGLGKKDVQKQVLHMPTSVEEQQKIAAVLSAADKEIDLLQQKLDALKQEKKALMQQLLTGKRRVQLTEQNTKATTYGN